MNVHRRYWVLSALSCLILTFALAIDAVQAGSTQQAETDFAAIDAYVAGQMDALNLPGIALGIVQNGEVTHLQGFGVADSSGRTVTPQTPFYIGSVTKSFTAMAVMQLVEAGKIDLDAPVQTYLPWFELADKEASAEITVRHLLNQASGLSTKDGNRFWRSRLGLEETVRGLDTVKLTKPVGSTYQYSNLNYMIAGLIVQVVSGQPYAEYVTEHILEPLDMRHSYASPAPAMADGLAEGHIYVFGRLFADEGPQPPANLPAGTLIASVEDLSHYAIAHLKEGRYGDGAVLSPQGIDELHAPAIPMAGAQHYAMGWNVGTADGVPYLVHAGDAGRNHAIILLMPDSDSAVILLANASGFVQVEQVNQMGAGVFHLLNGNPASPVFVPLPLRLQYWGLLLTPLLQILGIVLVWHNRGRMKVWGAGLAIILNLAVVFALLKVSLQIITLPSLLVIDPDVGYALVVIATLGIGWSVVYATTVLLRRRSI